MKNVVLVHGGFVDGSGWEGVYKILKHQGYNVSVVQNPTISLQGGVEVTKRVIAAQDGPAILVGHSYGGAVISAAGAHPNVAALVYITAFAPDKGESVGALIQSFPSGGPHPPILPPQDGFLSLDKKAFPGATASLVTKSLTPWDRFTPFPRSSMRKSPSLPKKWAAEFGGPKFSASPLVLPRRPLSRSTPIATFLIDCY